MTFAFFGPILLLFFGPTSVEQAFLIGRYCACYICTRRVDHVARGHSPSTAGMYTCRLHVHVQCSRGELTKIKNPVFFFTKIDAVGCQVHPYFSFATSHWNPLNHEDLLRHRNRHSGLRPRLCHATGCSHGIGAPADRESSREGHH